MVNRASSTEFDELIADLLGTIVDCADQSDTLADRRERLMASLGELTGSDCGWWSWGRGHPAQDSVTAIAVVPFGFEPGQFGSLIGGAFEPEKCQDWRHRILQVMQSEALSVVRRNDIFTDAEWHESPFGRYLRQHQLDEWLHALRYSNEDTWSNIFLGRRPRQLPYSPTDVEVVRHLLKSVRWLHAASEEVAPSDRIASLGPRQRSVLVMLLDGRPRKAIAAQLGIGEDTVGDHLKAIYRHFRVNSATELAAVFLRGR